MKDEDKRAENAIRLLAILAVLFLIWGATACRSVQVVTEYREKVVHDSVLRVDSVWRDRVHTEYQKGDTIFIHDSVYVGNFKSEGNKLEVTVHDSIPYPVKVKVPGPVRNSRMAKIALWWFWISVIAAAFTVAWKLFKKYYLRR